MKEVAPLGALGVGLALLGLSAVWGLVFPASMNWSEEKAARMSELSNEAHVLLYKADAEQTNPQTGEPGEAQQAYKAVKDELATLRKDFENQRDRPNTVARYMRWTGIGLVLLGGLGVMILKES
jgi:hypothetical protein